MGVSSWGTWAVLPRTGSRGLGALGNPRLEHDPGVPPFTTHCLALPTGERAFDCGS